MQFLGLSKHFERRFSLNLVHYTLRKTFVLYRHLTKILKAFEKDF